MHFRASPCGSQDFGTARDGTPDVADQPVHTTRRQAERISCGLQYLSAMWLPTRAACRGSVGTRVTQRCRLPRGAEKSARKRTLAQVEQPEIEEKASTHHGLSHARNPKSSSTHCQSRSDSRTPRCGRTCPVPRRVPQNYLRVHVMSTFYVHNYTDIRGFLIFLDTVWLDSMNFDTMEILPTRNKT